MILNKIKKVIKKHWKSFIEILVYLLAFIFYFYIGNAGFKYLSSILFTKEGFDIVSVLSSILAVSFFIWVVWITVEFLLIFFKRTKKLSKNKYLISAITFIIIILIFGISLIRITYMSPYPLIFDVYETKYTLPAYLECYSSRGFPYILIGDSLKCDITITSKKEGFMNLTNNYNVRVGKYLPVTKNWSMDVMGFRNLNKTKGFSYLKGIRVPITEKQFTQLNFKIDFIYNDTLRVNLDSNYNWIIPITYEEYIKKLNERLSLLLLLFSLAFFSVLSGVRNLKNIIENK